MTEAQQDDWSANDAAIAQGCGRQWADFVVDVDQFRQEALTVWPGLADSLHPDVNLLAHMGFEILKAIAALRQSFDYVQQLMVGVVGVEGYVDVPNLGRCTRRNGTKRTKWDHDSLATQVARGITANVDVNISDGETGEVWDVYAFINEILKRFRDTSSDGWKVTGLRRLGIDPGDYCEQSWGNKTIEFPPVEAE